MKINTKVLFILSVVWAVIILGIYSGTRMTLMDRFEKIEKLQVVSDVMRAKQAFISMEHTLDLMTINWGLWDDAYYFFNTKNRAFIDSNLQAPAFKNAHLGIIGFFDPSWNLYYGRNYDLTQKKFIAVPDSLIEHVKTGIFNETFQKEVFQSGVIELPEGVLVFSTSPVVKSDGTGKPHGVIMMGYFLKNDDIKKLSGIVRLPYYFYQLPLATDNPTVRQGYEALLKEDSSGYSVVTHGKQDAAFGFTFINDLKGHPIALLGVRSGRILYKEGLTTLRWYLYSIVLLGIGVLLSVWFLLKYLVLDRLVSVSRQVVDISKDNTFTKRIDISGNDELTVMVGGMNNLLEIIELTEDQLKSRIANRTTQLEHLSNLNKNLFDAMNHQKTVEEKLRAHEKHLKNFAYYDQLTGLPNRIFFRDQVQKLIERAAKNGAGIVIMFLDADKFKDINDTYGHSMGDKFLCHIAGQLKKIIKDSDMVARYAGDEFVVFLNNMRDKSIISMMAEKILKSISEPFIAEGAEIHPSFSLGISVYPENGTRLADLEHSADLAMYHAKKRQGNIYCYAGEQTEALSVSREEQ